MARSEEEKKSVNDVNKNVKERKNKVSIMEPTTQELRRIRWLLIKAEEAEVDIQTTQQAFLWCLRKRFDMSNDVDVQDFIRTKETQEKIDRIRVLEAEIARLKGD